MRNTLIAASALALMAGGANAAVQSFTTGPVFASGNTSGTVSVAAFNAALGTLIDTRYRLTIDPFASGSITNQSGAMDDYTIEISGGYSVTGDVAPEFFLGVFGSATILGLADGATAPFVVDPVASVTGFSSLGAFAGPVEADYSQSAAFNVADGNAPASVTITQAGIYYTLEVEYEYDPVQSDVPIPAALPLLAAAFGVMGIVRARRN